LFLICCFFNQITAKVIERQKKMKRKKRRHPASQALIDLRKALGDMTQQDLAVKVLECAVATISRYESFGPPKGEALLKLRDVAHEKGLVEIAGRFQELWLAEVYEGMTGIETKTIVINSDEPPSGLLMVSLPDGRAIRAAKDFLTLLQHIASGKEPYKSTAISLFKAMQQAAEAGVKPLEVGIADAFFGKHK
jgi:hypothetical protein